MCLGTLPVSDLTESDDCTDCCVWGRFQSLVYLRVTDCCVWIRFQSLVYMRVTTVQTDGSGNASSLLFT
ncbi:hypothetical protein DPMN_080721 [Dreissena polymorpha]|uniref:Uncharacterized protein n=1 Tax=Dreissena polymorpha TaxID=45954 RepID=A0A9D3YRE5_DREPO|nr:hypothetical protein DPMN_080721 [Dreissena polymorpha]